MGCSPYEYAFVYDKLMGFFLSLGSKIAWHTVPFVQSSPFFSCPVFANVAATMSGNTMVASAYSYPGSVHQSDSPASHKGRRERERERHL